MSKSEGTTTTRLALPNELHEKIQDKQRAIKKKHGVKPTIEQVILTLLKLGLK